MSAKIHVIKPASTGDRMHTTFCGLSGTRDAVISDEYITMGGRDARFEAVGLAYNSQATCKKCRFTTNATDARSASKTGETR